MKYEVTVVVTPASRIKQEEGGYALRLFRINDHRSGQGVDVRAGSGPVAPRIGRRQVRLGS
jgi:hypothetical protein